MKRICAWCRSEIDGSIGEKQSEDDVISHGICRSCADNISFQQGVPLPVYLDSFDAPVFILNNRCEIQDANLKARKSFAGGFTLVKEHKLTGDVFECQYARLPEGCGKTIHCSGCAIRRAIRKTIETGEPQSKIPATLRRNHSANPKAISLFITTVKSGDAVLLKLDDREEQAPPGA